MTSAKPLFEDPERDPAAKEKIYPELARANLLRMRGDYKGAIDQCLSILKRMPDDLDAHTLIADIYSESGDLLQAAQWYELALEVDPDSSSLKAKFDAVRERAQHKEIAETAEQLGLPTDGPRIMIYGSIVIVLVVVIGIAAYLLGQQHPIAKRSPLRFSIDAPGTPDKPNSDSSTDDSSSADTPNGSNANAMSAFLPQDDRTLTLTLSQRDPLGSHIMSVLSDPRSKVLTINYSVGPGDDQQKIGAELARSSFEQDSDADTITLRGIRDGKLVFVADAHRDTLNDAVSNAQAQAGSPDAWISSALSSVWTPPVATPPQGSPSSTGASGSTPAASGSASTGSSSAVPATTASGTAASSTTGSTTPPSTPTTGN